MYNTYILENMKFCLTKKHMTFLFHLFDLVWIEGYISNLKIDIQQVKKVYCIT